MKGGIFMVNNIEETAKEFLQKLSPCPRYESCVTAKTTNSLNCSVYGCNAANEHSAIERIYSELHINGNLKQRREVIQIVKNEIAHGRFQLDNI